MKWSWRKLDDQRDEQGDSEAARSHQVEQDQPSRGEQSRHS
jgi:hypothetical protein